jgi:hypothetical protein
MVSPVLPASWTVRSQVGVLRVTFFSNSFSPVTPSG